MKPIRISIIGIDGSGKSAASFGRLRTLSLSKCRVNLPCFDIDENPHFLLDRTNRFSYR